MHQADFISILSMGSERAVADLAVAMLESSPGSFSDMLHLCFLEQYPRETPGVRIFAMEVVFLIGRKEPDLLRELTACLEILDEEKIPSLQARISMLRVKLK
ncbi:MAG: hypothetical protein K0B08_08540 [Bacteroidales bacterium]|nr:hypothetical protein [Bacteroidales bacterium]